MSGDTSRIFKEKKYAMVRGLLDPDLCEFYHVAALAKARSEPRPKGDDQVPGTPARYGDPLMEKLLELVWPRVEELSGLSLHPANSYFRLYKRGDVLERHTDREACEVSVSLCLGQAPERPWPLWIEGPQGTAGLEMAPGDGVIYRGIECPHWREPCTSDHVAQVFLHYVERDGPNAELKFDRRSGLYRRSSRGLD